MNHKNYLGGLTASEFLTKHWQKTPLLIHNAIKTREWGLSLSELIELSHDPRCSARLVIKNGSKYEVSYGPVTKKELGKMPKKNWTLLVQGINHVHCGVEKLLRLFSFIPFARLDDVMVSYAAPGGSVGPHFDSYDVFLLQGAGVRQWGVGKPSCLKLLPNQDLRILKSFVPDGTCQMQAGDMLYVPPKYSHHGVALEPCLTYSIGFKSPRYDHIKSEFLHYLDQELELPGLFNDPNRQPTNVPALIPTDLLQSITQNISKIRWSEIDILKFTGEFLTQMDFEDAIISRKTESKNTFLSRLKNRSYRINSHVKFLYRGGLWFIAGETFTPPKCEHKMFKLFANRRVVNGKHIDLNTFFAETLYKWEGKGYVTKTKT
jgi:50S ribosomal protein L16 3-hydroxylase